MILQSWVSLVYAFFFFFSSSTYGVDDCSNLFLKLKKNPETKLLLEEIGNIDHGVYVAWYPTNTHMKLFIENKTIESARGYKTHKGKRSAEALIGPFFGYDWAAIAVYLGSIPGVLYWIELEFYDPISKWIQKIVVPVKAYSSEK